MINIRQAERCGRFETGVSAIYVMINRWNMSRDAKSSRRVYFDRIMQVLFVRYISKTLNFTNNLQSIISVVFFLLRFKEETEESTETILSLDYTFIICHSALLL